MSAVRNEEEIALMREGGRRLARVLNAVKKTVVPSVSTADLDALAEKLIREGGDEPAFLNYTPWGADRPYPATLCVSINDEVVHGIPNEDPKILREGDIVSLDIGLRHKGYFVDMAETVPVGKVSPELEALMAATKESLRKAIAVVKDGVEINEIGIAIEKYVLPLGYGIVEDLGGHGVGKKVHEPPYIHNYAQDGKSPKLKEGMTIALEPMLNLGSPDVRLAKDGYTYLTKDGKPSAHFEHTILVTKKGAEVLTKE